MTLKYKHFKTAVDEAVNSLKDYWSGKSPSLYTKTLTKLDKVMRGWNWWRIYALAGASGSGKSTILEQIKRELCDNNPNNFDILSFEFEMLGVDQALRGLSGKLEVNIDELHDNRISNDKLDIAVNDMSYYPIYYVDEVGSVKDIVDTIDSFVEENTLKSNKGLIVTIDHSLLTKNDQGDDEKKMLSKLMHTLVRLKKYYYSKNVKIMFIVLSQLNREIEKPERILNPVLHYPNKNDLFGSSSVYYCSDYVIITHKPSIIEGIGKWYGPPKNGYPKGLPVFHPEDETIPLLYWHVIKARFGTNKILIMIEDFIRSRVLEY